MKPQLTVILIVVYLAGARIGVRGNVKAVPPDATVCKRLPNPEYLKPGIYPKTALASFQGSGNTWVRQVLGSASGVKTGDVFHSYGDDSFPEFSSRQDDTVIAIKTHYFSLYPNRDFKRAVVIVRHPLDALFAEFNRVYGGNKTGYAERQQFVHYDGTPTWQWDLWMTHIGSWVDFHIFWLEEFKGDVNLIYYDNLKTNTRHELSRVIKFLGVPLDPVRLDCTTQYPKPPYFKRTQSSVPVNKADLFRLSSDKASRAIDQFRRLVVQRFGINSDEIRSFSLKLSVSIPTP